MLGIHSLKRGEKVESRVKQENFIVVQGWMITELQLKGNELLVYAIIYGFSQAESQVFTGSLQYLADWTLTSKQTVITSLKSLIEKGLIVKTEKIVNGVKFCEYYSKNLNGVCKNLEQGCLKNLNEGSQNFLPNNISIYNSKNNIENNIGNKRFVKPTFEEVQAYCQERNNSVDAKAFFDYYNAGDWKDAKGKPVRNWKQKVITWERSNNNGNSKPSNGRSKPSIQQYADEC